MIGQWQWHPSLPIYNPCRSSDVFMVHMLEAFCAVHLIDSHHSIILQVVMGNTCLFLDFLLHAVAYTLFITARSHILCVFPLAPNASSMALSDPLSQSRTDPAQNQLANANLVCARSLPIKETCEYAGSPMTGPEGSPVLKVHGRSKPETVLFHHSQPSAIAWMMAQEGIPICGGILADACGLGKTLSAMCLVHFATTTKAPTQVQDYTQSMIYHPLTIIVPASVILHWVDQIDHFFKHKLTVMIFWGSSENGDTSWKERTVNTMTDLRSKLGGLDVDDPRTGCTVVVTSYQTWTKRTTKSNKVPESSKNLETG